MFGRFWKTGDIYIYIYIPTLEDERKIAIYRLSLFKCRFKCGKSPLPRQCWSWREIFLRNCAFLWAQETNIETTFDTSCATVIAQSPTKWSTWSGGFWVLAWWPRWSCKAMVVIPIPYAPRMVYLRPKRVCCPRLRGNIQREAQKRGRREHFGHWGSWSFVMLGSWVLDLTPSQTRNPKT